MSVSEVPTDLADSMPESRIHGREDGLGHPERAPDVVAELTAALRTLEGHARRKLSGSSVARGEYSERGWPVTQVHELVPSRVKA